ncbi:MAG: YbaK/EbsC family protein [Candidatus Latescibacterota bacterium]
MPLAKLCRFLDENGADYAFISHSPAFTAQEVAASAHIPGRQVAKTVMVKVDGKMVMAVLPALYEVDLESLREAVGAARAELAQEEEFTALFPDCTPGGMPPFGNLYGLDVLVDPSLAEDEEIAFNAGNHRDMIRMPYADFERLVQPTVVPFAETARV